MRYFASFKHHIYEVLIELLIFVIMISLGLKRILRIIGLVWLMALSTWTLMKVVNSLAIFGNSHTIISSISLLLLGSIALAFILGGSGK